MATSIDLAIHGYRGEFVPNRLSRPSHPIDALAMLLPGFGYTLDMPLFSYAENLLLQRGWDVLRVEYAYNRLPESETEPWQRLEERLYADATAAWRAGIAQREYARMALIGKSLGTLAMGALLTTEERPTQTSAVWLTPLLSVPRLREQIAQYGGSSLFVIGTADPHYDADALKAMTAATSGEAVVVEGANHGMDIAGDSVASVRALERVVAAYERFI